MIVSLVVASCGTATEEEEEEKEEVVTGTEKPQYGGTITIALARDISNFANGLEFC
jgi:hypothetical protein